MGAELGARPDDPTCYVNGRASFEKLRKSAAFQQGIERLLVGVKDCTITLMCSEKEPMDCHRTILVARMLADRRVMVQHILENGDTIDQPGIENQLMEKFKLEPDFFTGRGQSCSPFPVGPDMILLFNEKSFPKG